MDLFEPHIHMISRVTDDYERMSLAGVRAMVEPSFWLGEPRTRAETHFDYFRSILGFETERARGYGIDHYVALAMNPREANDRPMAKDVLAGLPAFLARDRVVAVGEVGFDEITPAEEEAVRAQVTLAESHRLPLLVHTPHRNKLEGTKRTIAVLREMRFDPARTLIDHSTEETTKLILDFGAWAGHTVYPVTKLSPDRAVNILDQNGTERMLVNSSADWGPSDSLSVARVALEMRRRGYAPERIRAVVWENPVRFYGLSGRLRISS